MARAVDIRGDQDERTYWHLAADPADPATGPLYITNLDIFSRNHSSCRVAAFTDIYPTAVACESFARLAQTNLAFTALYGKLYGSSIGALIAWRYSVIGVWAALASFLTVIRHTRTEEEAGRRELLGSTVLGRYAPLSAALIVTY